MFYHASQTPDLKTLIPHISNHLTQLIYFSKKRANVLVYLSNAVQKYCEEINYKHNAPYIKWASYGFNKDGILVLEEYYPNAIIDTYKNVPGYIYSTNKLNDYNQMDDIPYAVTTNIPTHVEYQEFIPDAYDAIIEAAQNKEIILHTYEENNSQKLQWIRQTIISEYDQAGEHPEYQLFLKAKFDFL